MSEPTDTPSLDLSRRTFVKGVGAAGLASTATDTAVAAVDDDDVVTVGAGSFTTAIPAGYDYPSPPDPTYVTDDVSPPIPTNDWWSGLLFGNFSAGPVVGLPFHGEAGPDGFTASYPTDWAGDPAERDTVVVDAENTPGVTVGHADVEAFADARVADWGDWHVRTRWGAGTDTSVDVTVARGMPLVFAEYDGGGAELTFSVGDEALSESQVAVWEDRGSVLGVSVTANGYEKHFGVFAPSGASWSGAGSGSMTSELGNGDYLTVALLPAANSALLDRFEAHAYDVVRGTEVDWEYVRTDESGAPVSEVRTTYSFTTESKPESRGEGTLTALFPHQWKHVDGDLADVSYWSPRGELKVSTGPSFSTTHTYQGTLPFTPTEGTQDPATLESYVTDLMADHDRYVFGVPRSAYWVGKDFFRNGTAAAIADRTGQTEAADYFLGAVTDRLEAWLTANDISLGTEAGQELFYYDDGLGSLFEYPTEFGSVGAVNDHHFHYGYFVYAAAEVARQNPDWASEAEWGGMVDRLVRDYANWDRPDHDAALDPADDPANAFPFLRNFDVYAGHSWAGGTVGNRKGNNQESSSEAVMAYAAMIRWGELTGDDALRDAGVFLYTQETAAVWEYWFDPEDDSQPDDWGADVDSFESGGPDFEYASNVWGSGYWRHLWWAPSDPVEIFGINWLPVGPHSFYLGEDLRYANSNWSALVDARDRHLDVDDPTSEFLAGFEPCAWGYRAMSDPSAAAALMDDALPVDPGGSSTPFVYNFVYFLAGAGLVDTSVVADVPFYRVFEDGDRRTYVAYNADSSPRTVSFSDGMELRVPGEDVVVARSADHYDPDTQAPTAPGDLSTTVTNSFAVELDWTAATDDSLVQYYAVYLNGDERTTVADPGVRIDGLDRGTTYAVAVSAVDPFGNESNRASLDVTTDAEDTARPTAPTGLGSPTKSQTSVELSWNAASDVGEGSGISHYLVAVDERRYISVVETSVTVTDLEPGTAYTFTVRAVDDAGNRSEPVRVQTKTVAEGADQTPFEGRATIPGTIQAENFDRGGEAVAYHETSDVNQAGADYRDAPVDVGDAGGGNYTLGWIAPGEWLEYSVTVESDGEYDVLVAVASAQGGGPLHVEVDGENVTGSIDVPNTGSWTSYQTVTGAEGVSLSAGDHVIRVVSEEGAWNFDWLRFETAGGSDEPSTTAVETTTATTATTVTTTSGHRQSKTEPSTAAPSDGGGFGPTATLFGLFGLGVAGIGAYLARRNDDEGR